MLDWSPIILTLQLALITTVILLVISIPLAYWMANTKSRIKPIIEAIVSLPLVLPPTVLGFYLLIAFSPESAIGSFLNDVFGLHPSSNQLIKSFLLRAILISFCNNFIEIKQALLKPQSQLYIF